MLLRLRAVALKLALPGAIVAVWVYVSHSGTSLFFPPLSDVWVAFREDWFGSNIERHILPSLRRLAIGFAFAIIGGVLIGAAMGLSRRLRRAVRPITEYLRATPSVALIPLAFVLIGPGEHMEIAIIAYGSMWPIVVATTDAVSGAESLMIETGKAYGLSRRQIVTHVVLPAALPGIAGGIHVATQFAVGLMVLANFVGAASGMGYFVLTAQQSFDIDSTWSGLVLLGIIGASVTLLVRLPERWLLAWHRGWRSSVRAE